MENGGAVIDVDFLANQAVTIVQATATHIATLNGAAQVAIVFERDYIDALGVASTAPVAIVADRALPELGASEGDALDVGGTPYTVVAVEPDGTGMTILRLHRAD